MIKRLDLQNFQSHKNTTIEFSDGVNTIIGPSDSGKTSIIRALKWVMTNRPLGDDFIRHDEDQTVVMLGLSEGLVIERAKGKNDHYKLHSDGNILEFKAFGKEVPEEITKALNFDDINIQNQLDSPFLLADNSGEVSRHFNKIANIEKIDSSLKSVEKWIRSITQDIKFVEQTIDEKETALSNLEYLDRMETDVEALESLEQDRNQKIQKREAIIYQIEKLRNTNAKIKKAEKRLNMEKPVIAILADMEVRSAKQKERGRILELFNKYKKIAVSLKKKRIFIRSEKLVESALSLYKKKEELEQEHFQLDHRVDQISTINHEIKKLKLKLEADVETLASEMPEVCPLCDQPIN